MNMPFDYYQLLKILTDLPHRGVGSIYEKKAAKIIHHQLHQLGFNVIEQPFDTPKTYVVTVFYHIGFLLIGLLFGPHLGLIAIAALGVLIINALLFFDWRAMFTPTFWPYIQAHNIIGLHRPAEATHKIVLMAHYDSAPVSALYRKQTKNGFRASILVSMALMALAIPLIVVSYFYPENYILLIIRILFAIYFVGQATLGTIDYFRKGFTNGASDNATGVVAAIATAQKLKNQLSHTTIEVALTSAEEVGMVGALAYQKKFFKEEGNTYLINFDTLGQGDLKIITKTGSFTTVCYENEVTAAAESIAKADPRFANVTTGSWHTADFDSVWFVRAGVACLTLAALDANGLMPNIHRPNDTLDNIDTQPMLQAIELAEAIGLKLCR